MANNKRIQIQHWYTTGNTAPSGTGLTNMLLGEIAIATQTDNEGIFIKNNAGSAVTFITSAQTDTLITNKLAEAGVATNEVVSAISQSLSTHIATDANNAVSGHVTLEYGDLNGKTAKPGVAAGLGHTHSQYQPKGDYLTGVTAGSGLAIAGIIENGDVKLQLDSETNDKINSGVTAYDWGNHADEGYAKNDDLTAHTGNNDIHVTKEQKDEWTKAKEDIDAFLFAAESGTTAIDTLKELQEYIDTHGTAASGMTTAINQNTTDINNINSAIGSGFDSGNTIATNITGLKDSMIVTGEGGSNISVVVGASGNSGRKITIMHTGATAENENKVLTGTTTTALTWGGTFIVPTRISHDANGHYVSGTTSTFTMPTLPIGTNEELGIVKVSDIIYENTQADKLLHGNYLTASAYHVHNQYATLVDLGMSFKDDVTVISCGTY